MIPSGVKVFLASHPIDFRRTKGTCDNRMNIRRDMLEQSVLNGLDKHLMEPELYKEFCDEFTREVNKARMEARVSIDAAETETKRIDRELEKILDLYLKDALSVDMVKERSTKLEARKKELAGFLDGAEEPPPLLHPNLAKYYHEEIAALHDQLGNEETQALAADKLRTLVSRIDLVPDGGELVIVLRGWPLLGARSTLRRSAKSASTLMRRSL